MYLSLKETIEKFSVTNIDVARKEDLISLIKFIQVKKNEGAVIRLNFICTHNSRRSHLAQVWAQTMAFHFGIKNVCCYSGGTEATAMFYTIAETLALQGFKILKLAGSDNPVYAVKFSENENPIIAFSKTYYHEFNPKGDFGAVLTCSNADEGCPIVKGAAARFSIKYEDPKEFDGTALQAEMYAKRSNDIGQEMWYVFSQII